MTLRKREALEIERGNTRLHSAGNSLWTSLWTCHKAHYRMNEMLSDTSFVLVSTSPTTISAANNLPPSPSRLPLTTTTTTTTAAAATTYSQERY